MEKDFIQLESEKASNGYPNPDFTLSFYHRYDIANSECEYTSGFAYNNKPDVDVDSEHESGEIPPHKA